jgi:spoIIIJ-associated protein
VASPAADGDDPEDDFDPRSAVRSIVRAVAEAAGIDVSAEIDDAGSTFVVRLLGPDTDFFLGREGAILRALEQLLQRMYGYDVEPQRILIDCAGYRDQREEALRNQARTLAAAVRRDGTPRTTDPMNSYERRIIHVALSEERGVRTFSVGEGSNRRVTIAVAEGGDRNEP